MKINDSKLGRKKELKKVLIYCRVSTTDQNVKQQSKYIRTWCKGRNWIVEEAILDKESGRLPLLQRKNFRRLLIRAKSRRLDIIVLSLDRLTRNWDDVVFIEQHFRGNWDDSKLIATNFDVALHNAMGRFLFRVFMAQACFMPEDMIEKQAIGIERGIKEGKYKGRKKGSKNKNGL